MRPAKSSYPICVDCKKPFVPKISSAKLCESCRDERKRLRHNRMSLNYYYRKKAPIIGGKPIA